jgi:hypothetical protein
MINNIVVNFPITVPSGNYCRHYKTKALCKYFNNEGGQNSCDMGYLDQRDDEVGVVKDHKCANLEFGMIKFIEE